MVEVVLLVPKLDFLRLVCFPSLETCCNASEESVAVFWKVGSEGRCNLGKRGLKMLEAEARLRHVGKFKNKAFGFFPAKAGVGNAFAVYAITDFLRAILDVAFNHEAFDQRL